MASTSPQHPGTHQIGHYNLVYRARLAGVELFHCRRTQLATSPVRKIPDSVGVRPATVNPSSGWTDRRRPRRRQSRLRSRLLVIRSMEEGMEKLQQTLADILRRFDLQAEKQERLTQEIKRLTQQLVLTKDGVDEVKKLCVGSAALPHGTRSGPPFPPPPPPPPPPPLAHPIRAAVSTCFACKRHKGQAPRDESEAGGADWASLPRDAVLEVLERLGHCDRANMAAACRAWRALASTPCLWTSLDLRAHRCGAKVAASLASRCGGLRRLHLRGHEAAAAAPLLHASGLREVMLDECSALTDITLAVLAARHAALESIQVGLERIELVSSVALRHIAHCCPHLRRLRLCGLRDASADAVGALASYCPQLEEVAFADCRALDAAALGGFRSLRFISVSGCANLNWAAASASWAQLPSLLAVDVSRTDVPAIVVSHLLSRCETLKLVWTFGCKFIAMELAENPTTFSNHSGKLVPISSTNIFESVISMFSGKVVKEQGDYNLRNKDKLLDDTMTWLEWILSYSGISSLLTLLQSSQEDVQIRAVVTLSMFNHFCENLWEAIVQHGMIPMLLDFAKSSKESTQLEAAKAISSLFSDEAAVDTVADQGGIAILVNLAKSMNRLVAKEAANGLRLLSTNEDQLDAIVAADGIKPLVDLIFRSPADSDEVLADAIAVLQNLGPRLEVVKAGGIHALVDLIARLACLCRPLSYEVLYGAVDTLATLADDDECSMEVTKAGGVHALDKLAQLCEDRVHQDIQNKAATALAYLAAHEYKNKGNAAVGQEAGAIDAFIQLLSSQNERVRESAVDALSCLSGDRYREALAWFSLAHENV